MKKTYICPVATVLKTRAASSFMAASPSPEITVPVDPSDSTDENLAKKWLWSYKNIDLWEEDEEEEDVWC